MISIGYGSRTVDERLARLIGTEGLDASCIEVSSQEFASRDGGQFSGFRLSSRTVRLRYAIVGDPEEARSELKAAFPLASSGTLEVSTRDWTRTATGYVTALEFDPWTMSQGVEVTLRCLDPWLYGRTRTASPTATGWSVEIEGSDVGFRAQVDADSAGSLTANGETIAWSQFTGTSGSGHRYIIDTREGHRGMTLLMDGRDCTRYITRWEWPQLVAGENEVSCTSATGDLEVTERWPSI